MTSLKSNSTALKQIRRSGPPNDWLHTALTPHSFKLVDFCSLSSLHPEDESTSSPVGKQTVEQEKHDACPPGYAEGKHSDLCSDLFANAFPLMPEDPREKWEWGLAPGNWRFIGMKQYTKWFRLSISSFSYLSTALASNLDSFILFVKEFPNIYKFSEMMVLG